MFNLDDIGKFILKYQPEGIIIDTKILILFLVGSYDPTFIENCELLNNSNEKYSTSDFELLKKIFHYFKKLVITPQVIAELSNLSITKNIYGDRLMPYLQTVVKFFKLKEVEEHYQKSDCLWEMELKVISLYGLIDMTMFELSKQTKMPILTDDLPFYVHSYEKVPIIKFKHIKNQEYQSILK